MSDPEEETRDETGDPQQQGTSASANRSKRKRSTNFKDYFVSHQETKPQKSRSKKNKQLDPEDEFDTVWICSECKEAECMMKPEADRLLICEGPCRRLFHYPCAGLAQLPSEDETYVCNDCQNGRHQCAICQDYGVDDIDLFRCGKEKCGLFFHEACLAMQNVEFTTVEGVTSGTSETSADRASEDNGATTTKLQFVCPAHSCWTCTQTDLKESETKDGGKKKSKGSKRSTAFDCKSEKLLVVSCCGFASCRSLLFASLYIILTRLTLSPALHRMPHILPCYLHPADGPLPRTGTIVSRRCLQAQTARA